MNRPLSEFKVSLPHYEMTDDVAEKSYVYSVLSFIHLLCEAKKSKTINFSELEKAVFKYSKNYEMDCFGMRWWLQKDQARDFKRMHLKYPIIKAAANGLLEVWEIPRGKEFTKIMGVTEKGKEEAEWFLRLITRHNSKFLECNLSLRIGQFKQMLAYRKKACL